MTTTTKTLTLHEKIMHIRVELQQAGLKKSGKNSYQKFTYFELSDFLPTANVLMNKYGVSDEIHITRDEAKLILRDNSDDTLEYTIPFVLFDTPANKNGVKTMQDIQYLGGLITYSKRYLYYMALGISDGEVVDAMRPAQETVASTRTVACLTALQKQVKDKLNAQHVAGSQAKAYLENALGTTVAGFNTLTDEQCQHVLFL